MQEAPLYPVPMFHPTEEQQSVVESQEKQLKVNAFAGTGKTSTLVAYTKARPSQPILYVAFNKSVQDSAARKFPRNVTCKTGHALAYRFCGASYRHKLKPNIKPKLIAPLLNSSFKEASYAIKTLQNYLYSIDLELQPKHVDESVIGDKTLASHAFFNAERLWKLMCNLDDNTAPMIHDGYLKLFHLSKPDLSSFGTILFDEAQDANPVMADIILNQRSTLVLMGDKHQSIYGWRGARNVMEAMPGFSEMYLSQSFRFGQKVADVANLILGFKNETVALIGLKAVQSDLRRIDTRVQHTVLARTNASLFDHAVENLTDTISLFFVGGFHSNKIISAHNLKFGGPIYDSEVRSFSAFQEMSEYAKDVGDPELEALCKLVEKYGRDLPQLVQWVSGHITPEQDDARIILSTAHRAKGLEFKQVLLKNDFLNPLTKDINPEEINLLYVAATRAVHVLELNPLLKKYMENESEREAARKEGSVHP